jgi:hypothetical protein
MYFQMLAHKLPDELPIFLLVDERGVASVSDILRFLADDRWVHFSVGLRTERVPRDGWVWDESGVRVRKLDVKKGLVFTGEERRLVARKRPQSGVREQTHRGMGRLGSTVDSGKFSLGARPSES